MNRKLCLPVTITVVFCSLFLFWQHKEITDLKGNLSQYQVKITNLGNSLDVSRARSNSKTADLLEKERTINKKQEAAKLTVSDLLETIPDTAVNGGPAALMRHLPEILASLEDHSPSELFELLEELHLASDQNEKALAISGILFVLVSDVEPERVLALLDKSRKKESGSVKELQAAAFSSLARLEPEKAESYLKKIDWRGRQKQRAEMGILIGWTKVDFQKALSYLEESSLDSRVGISALVSVGQDPVVRDQMRDALAMMKDSKVRTMLTVSLMGSTYADTGYEGVSALLSKMEFATPVARDEALSTAIDMGLASKPVETIEWLKREASPGKRAEFLTNSVANWAHRDYAAAGEWLQTQEPSPDKDISISSYAGVVAEVDPTAAIVWADEIEDQKIKEMARKRAFTKWHHKDPAAAKAWLSERGWEASDWLSSSGR